MKIPPHIADVLIKTADTLDTDGHGEEPLLDDDRADLFREHAPSWEAALCADLFVPAPAPGTTRAQFAALLRETARPEATAD